jgi:c-di-GMP-binding flagellar brake protein YcgR
VEDLNEETISLAAPISIGAVVLAPGREIWVEFAAKSCCYRFPTVVLENIQEPIPLLVVMKPSTIERFNRRRFFRFQARLPVSFQRDKDQFTGWTVNLSGNGLSALFTGKLEAPQVGELVDFMLSLPKGLVDAKGKIVRREFQENNKTCLIAEFKNLPEHDRDRIIAFLFEEQRKFRKRGLV